ncbi:MAG: sulfide/dihydroorotate dehydrogenase-like FAD/NAD-binding protein [candidate division FCPU426 bacterium]
MNNFNIINKNQLSPDVWRYTLSAPDIARKRRAGHFIILRPLADSERIPLTIVSSDQDQGTIDIIFQVVGATTRDLAGLRAGEPVKDLIGPLGHPTEIAKHGTVAMVGGGVGIAPLLPIAQAFRAAGNRLVTILGARARSLLILEQELASISDKVLLTTDDGSAGQKGLVTAALEPLLVAREIDFVMAVGPVPMMKAVADLTRGFGVKTMVSLNPLMLDGTGMCGVCRCQVAGKTRFACVEGPEFDAHQVDFDSLRRRLTMFREEEKARREAKPSGGSHAA